MPARVVKPARGKDARLRQGSGRDWRPLFSPVGEARWPLADPSGSVRRAHMQRQRLRGTGGSMTASAKPVIECDQLHPGIEVSDLTAAIDFYVKQLGFFQAFTW